MISQDEFVIIARCGLTIQKYRQGKRKLYYSPIILIQNTKGHERNRLFFYQYIVYPNGKIDTKEFVYMM